MFLSIESSEKRMKEYSNYRDLNQMVDAGMQVLDEEFQVPDDLIEKILANRPQIDTGKIRRINFSVYAQIAAVLAIGVFLGVVLGRNANTDLLSSNKTKKEKSLIEYRASHNLHVNRTYFLK